MKIKFLLYVIYFQFAFIAKAQQTMQTEIWLADIRIKENNIYFGPANKITEGKEYNNQPCFLSDSTILYTHIGSDLQADIFQYHLHKKTNTKFTNTSTSEYSARLLPNKNGISVVEVEKDSTQRIWSFDKDGKNGKVLIKQIDSVGYYAWLSDSSIAAFILTQPPSLQIASSSGKNVKTIATDIGRCLQVSSMGNLYFTKLEKDSTRWLCRTEINGKITKLIEFYKGVEDFVLSNNSLVFCAKDGIIYYSDNQFNLGWRMCGDFSVMGINNINRLALSPNNKKIALVNLVKK